MNSIKVCPTRRRLPPLIGLQLSAVGREFRSWQPLPGYPPETTSQSTSRWNSEKLITHSCCRFASISEPGFRTLIMLLFVDRTILESLVSMLAQSARLEPVCGVPRKMMPAVDSRSAFIHGSAAPRETRSACSQTRPPRL